MKKEFSILWKGSKKPNKQKKYRFNAPLHIKQKLASSHLSKDLKKKYNKRRVSLRKGDKVKIMRGSFKKHEGKIELVDLSRMRVFVSGIERIKKDGTKKMLPFAPSNLTITELNMDDKLRQRLFGK